MFIRVIDTFTQLMGRVYEVMDTFLLESFPRISLFSFFLFLFFARIVLHLINFVKFNVDIETDDNDNIRFKNFKFRRYK